MDKLETLVVPEELGAWLESKELGSSGSYFTVINALLHYWENTIDSPTSDFIFENRKELIEVIIGSRGYRVETPLYYALVKGHELTSNEFKYWNFKAYSSGDLLIGSKYPQDDFVNRMTKSNWNEVGINSSNADFIEIENRKE